MASEQAAPRAYPVLRYDDARAAIDFLARAFGFEPMTVFDGDDGRVAHAELGWEGGVVMVGSLGDGGPFDLGPVCVYVAVDDPDAHHDRAVAAGAEVVARLTDMPYGSREYAARDPEGNVWSFGTYRPAHRAG